MSIRTYSIRIGLRSIAAVSFIIGSSSSAFAASPYMQTVSPEQGAPGTVVTITGTGLSGITAAWVGSAQDAGITNVSATTVKITIPQDAATGKIAIGNGSSWSFSPSAFVVTGAAVGSPVPPPVTPGTNSGGSSKLAVKVKGNHLVDASGGTLQLRGVSISGLESVAAQGWDPSNPWGGPTPNWSTITAWKANAVRLPLNEASWLGYSCKDATGVSHNPDPGANYKATVEKTVADATAAGLYVILDLHWTAPGASCPLTQNQMADTDHSTAFWTSVATQFKGSANVLFELFNEPFADTGSSTEWSVIMKGGPATSYLTGGTPSQVNYSWNAVGMSQLLSAVRATGATNVVLVGAPTWSQDLSLWTSNKPSDPAGQMAASWHAYPSGGDTFPAFGTAAYSYAQSIIDAGIPVVITETGDHNAAGTVGAPFLANLLPWADGRSVSYFGWTWNAWGDSDNVLIKDAAGDPTDGYGVFFKAHLTCLASGTASQCATSKPTPTPTPSPVPTPTPTPTPTPAPTPNPAPPGSAFWVYYNGVFNWGGDYSFVAKPNYKDTSGKPLSGPYDIAVTVTGPYGGFLPFAGGTVPLWKFNAAPYNYLTFAFKPTIANQTAQVFFVKVGDVPVGVTVNPFNGKYGPAPQVGVWGTYKIPLSDLGVKGTTVYKFGIQDESGLSHNVFYLDNIGFE